MIRAVIFDVDGTLTTQNFWVALNRDIGGSTERLSEIYDDYVNRKVSLNESTQKLTEMWQATGKANRVVMDDVIKRWPVRDNAKETIDWLKENGYVICLITSSPDMYAKQVAQKLGIQHYYSGAELHFDDKDELTSFNYAANQATVKVEQLNKFCALMEIHANECMAVGNGGNDVGLFKITKKGILLGQNKDSGDLQAAAWKVIEDLIEIKDLLQVDSSN